MGTLLRSRLGLLDLLVQPHVDVLQFLIVVVEHIYVGAQLIILTVLLFQQYAL
jgi:hypothetical protein